MRDHLERCARIAVVLVAALSGGAAAAQDGEAGAEALLARAQAVYLLNGGTEADARTLAEIRGLLDRIVRDYPETELAAAVEAGETVDGLDIAAIDAALAAAPGETDAPPAADAPGAEEGAGTGEKAPAAAAPAPPEAGPPAPETVEIPEELQALADLAAAVSACYFGAPELPAEARTVIAFELDGEGALVGVPARVEEGVAGAAERRLYVLGLLALENCTPLGTGLAPDVYEIEVAPDRIAALAPEPSADEDDETELGLSRRERREIQVRLDLLGHDPGPKDGIFGPNTRTAVAGWQEEAGLPATGYLDAPQLAAIRDGSREAYAAWQEERAREPARRAPRLVRVCREGIFGILFCRNEYR